MLFIGQYQMKKKSEYVSVYLRNEIEEPASYYRISQYLHKIDGVKIKINNAIGRKQFRRCMDIKSDILCYLYKIYLYGIINIREIYFLLRDIICRPKMVIISRTVIPKRLGILPYLMLEKVVSRCEVYWDFDDVIDLGEICRKQWKLLCEYSNKIVVTNQYLKNRIPEHNRRKVIILPTTDGDMQGFDYQKIEKEREESYEKEIGLLWLATAVNIPFLNRIIPAIDKCAKKLKIKKKVLKLYVVCNQSVDVETECLEIINIIWSKENSLQMLQKSHIGIMPLIDNEYTRGKGGFKLIQYMASCLPVIASDIGFSHFVVKEDTGILLDDRNSIKCWEDAIYYLSVNKEYWKNTGRQAYKKWKEDFSYEVNLEFWKKALSGINKERGKK